MTARTPAEEPEPQSAAVPLPPARTRWIEPREAGPGSGAMLGPVLSRAVHPMAGTHTATPAFAPTAGHEPFAQQEPAHVDVETLVLDEPVHEDFDAMLLEEPAVSPEPILLLEEADAAAEHTVVGDFAGMRPVHAPISPWELAGEPGDAVERGSAEDRLAKGQREWEAFGEGIMASLGIDETATLESAMRAVADHLERPETSDLPAVPAEIADLADRIASFASRLRAHGYHVIADAQAAGDRLDAALAGLSAAILEGYDV